LSDFLAFPVIICSLCVTGIKKYIVALIIKTSSDAALSEKEKTYLGKLNMILVQILKQDWPKNWPTFISDIVGASRTNESLCQNNMVILKLLRLVLPLHNGMTSRCSQFCVNKTACKCL